MLKRNPSIGQQVRKFGMPGTMYTHDLYAFRSKDGTTDKDRADEFGEEEFENMAQICIDFLLDMMALQKHVVLLGIANQSKIIPELRRRYKLERMEIKFNVKFLGENRPCFGLPWTRTLATSCRPFTPCNIFPFSSMPSARGPGYRSKIHDHSATRKDQVKPPNRAKTFWQGGV